MNAGEQGLISVLMPTYNVVLFVEEAVRSILEQTYANFELIIIDDASTDGTYELLEKIAKTDARIKLGRNERNMKICVALNKAWSLAKGEYIARMDGDDISMPERMETLKKFLDSHADVDLVGSQVVSIQEDGEILSYKEYLRKPEFIQRGNRIGPCVSHIWMARRSVYEALRGYRNFPFAEDYDFLLRGEKAGFRYANVDAYLYQVRIRGGNTGSTNGLRQRKAKDFVQWINLFPSRDGGVEELYQQETETTEKEQKSYLKAHKHIDIAVRSRKHPARLIYHVIVGMCESRYIRKYIFESVKLRLLLREEKRIQR